MRKLITDIELDEVFYVVDRKSLFPYLSSLSLPSKELWPSKGSTSLRQYYIDCFVIAYQAINIVPTLVHAKTKEVVVVGHVESQRLRSYDLEPMDEVPKRFQV